MNTYYVDITAAATGINSNKGCFWIIPRADIQRSSFRLTVTKVVFESLILGLFHRTLGWINSNKGCFWMRILWIYLLKLDKINSNKGCFWIIFWFRAAWPKTLINSNKGCFWILYAIYDKKAEYYWLTVTKVVFELAELVRNWSVCAD